LYQDFPFDGRVCYPSQLAGLIEEYRINIKESSDDTYLRNELDKLELIEVNLRTLQRKDDDGLGLGEPDPYLAILVADGDRMGKTISKMLSADKHRNFSKNLASFAKNAREIVENKHNGCIVYSGGDDVLAFLPVDTCLKAARDLHEIFRNLLNEYSQETGETPTLSVGIAIGHTREPLEDLLEYGRAAEKASKLPDRNGLALHLHTRSAGEPIKIREQWKPIGNKGLDERMASWVDMYLKDAFSDKTPYELCQLARDYRGWNESPPQDLLKKDISRLLKRKQADKGSKELQEEDIELLTDDLNSLEKLTQRAKELIIARKIAGTKIMSMGKMKYEVKL